MASFEKALVLRTQYTTINNPATLMTFTIVKIAIMKAAALYKPPAVPDVPYTDLEDAMGEVADFRLSDGRS